MSRICLRRTLMLAVLMLCVSSARSQEVSGATSKAATSKQGTYRIAGRVVSALDGHPLVGATISLHEVPDGVFERSVVAGAEGSFAFERLPAAKHSMIGHIRGYMDAAYDQHELFSTAIVTGAGIDTETLVLRLEPAAFVGGKVLDEFGEPVREAQVTVYREGYGTGKAEVTAASASQTDSFGEYAINQLPEGKYFIAVKATPWYAVYPVAPDPESPILTGVDPALNVVYPLTFYGDGTKADAATPIFLKPGARFHADVRLSPARAVRLTLPPAPGTQGGGILMLRTPVFGGFDQVMAQIRPMADGGSEIVGLAPGQYQAEATGQAESGLRLGELDLSQGSVALGNLGGEAEGSILLNVVEENGEKLPAQTTVTLRGTTPETDGRHGWGRGQMIDGDGKVTFNNLPPDDYRFLLFSGNHLWQTIRIEEDDKPLAQNHRRLAAGESATLRLVVAGTAKAVEGIALRDGKPMAGAMIVLVPVDAIENVELFRRDQSDQDGTFALPDVLAGRYIVVAIADGWKLEWGKLDVLSRFLGKGQAVEIPSSERKPVRLPRPIVVQDR